MKFPFDLIRPRLNLYFLDSLLFMHVRDGVSP